MAVLRHMAGVMATAHDVRTQESLRNYTVLHNPDLIIVNPMFDGLFDVNAFKASVGTDTRYIAIATTVTDKSVLAGYDESFTIYDSGEVISEKILKVLKQEVKEDEPDNADTLSQREKEIVICVVKGMTNKEIADYLCLSIHTVITHRRNISAKLQIHSAAGLTIYAIVNKLIDIKEVKDM